MENMKQSPFSKP